MIIYVNDGNNQNCNGNSDGPIANERMRMFMIVTVIVRMHSHTRGM